jgi:hypothetical protein
MMSNTKLDYAPHYLDAKKKLQEVHELLLKNRFIEAAAMIDKIVVELRMMRAAVKSHVE